MNSRVLIRLLPLLALLVIFGCSKMGLTPNPPGAERPESAASESGGKKPSGKKSSDKKSSDKKSSGKPEGAPAPSVWLDDGNLPDRKARTRDVDFARAFDDGEAARDTAIHPLPQTPVVRSLRYPPYKLPRRGARVALARNVRDAAVSSSASATALTSQARVAFRGRVRFEADLLEPGLVIATVGSVRKGLRLPCTLSVSGGQFEYGGGLYRGALVLAPDGGKTFSVINVVEVEDYLRGVVPLEIGNLREADIEAVKAQAVAARTYTYRKMAQNANSPFDLLPTTADQVYGGVAAEAPTSDMALLVTKDLIMVYEEAIVNAYYHSTCGGRTANVEDVWGGEPYPYLRSQSDADPRGRAYCAGTTTYTWTETWNAGQLAGVIRQHSAEGGLTPPFSGSLRRIEVRERFVCGRVRKLAVISSAGEHIAGGDKIRFALRRNVPSRQILRSANIQSVAITGSEVVIKGSGHGHGIGMCQVGAIARARSGQAFEPILKAYYSGISIRTVVP